MMLSDFVRRQHTSRPWTLYARGDYVLLVRLEMDLRRWVVGGHAYAAYFGWTLYLFPCPCLCISVSWEDTVPF